MDNWDDDDFDVTASAQSKLVDLALDKKVETPAPKVDNKRQAELEGLEAEKESDLNAAMALLDIAPVGVDASKKFESIKTRRQFEDYGIEMGQLYKSRSKDPNYMAFALPLIKESTANMSKIQLEEIQKVIQDYLNVFIKKEQDQKKAAEQKKQQKQKKKAVHHDDMIEGDYGDYEDKYY